MKTDMEYWRTDTTHRGKQKYLEKELS